MNAAPGTLEPPVLAWLGRELPGHRVVAAAPLSGGHSNDNTLVTTDRGRYVLRVRLQRQPARRHRQHAAVPRGIPGRLRRCVHRGLPGRGGALPPRWPEVSEALDLYALANFLTRPPGHPYFGKAVTLLKNRM
ncbi:MAG TPA: hypothetical protein VMC03_08060 [Streptosporangiaceae bacterium]|nr:hypothetical protein [Streptosporangiaceae bacterium]